MKPSLALAACLCLAALVPQPAGAHARFVRSEPADGAVLAKPPAAVHLFFDDAVVPDSATEAIRNGGGSVLAGEPSHPSGRSHEVIVPLRGPLRPGDYTVRWRVVSDDGHRLEGVLAFGVGAGRASPTAALSVRGTSVSARDVVGRWLFLAGLLTALGSLAFARLVWRPAAAATGLGGEEPRALIAIALVGFVLAFVGATALAPHHGGTRFALVYQVAGAIALVAAFVSALALADPGLRQVPLLLAALLLPAPTLAGHALDSGQSRVLSVPTDIAHTAAAAVWLGGLLALALAVPRAAAALDGKARRGLYGQVARRFSSVALPAVGLLAATGLARALSELASVSQLWSSGYGRALVVKSALLALLVTLGWMNRSRFLPRLDGARRERGSRAFARLRGAVVAEVALIAGVLVAVAFLTDLPPGRELAPARIEPAQGAATAPRRSGPPAPPPRDALVVAREAGELAVALALSPEGKRLRLRASVLGPTGDGVSDRSVRFGVGGEGWETTADGRPCGSGCYDAVVRVRGGIGRLTVQLDGRSVALPVPDRWPTPDASDLVRRAGAAFSRLRSVTFEERLSSGPTQVVRARFRLAAPDRLAYRVEGGPEAIIIGRKRWDRAPGGRWVPSEISPFRQPTPVWGSDPLRNARLLGTRRVAGRRAWLVSFYAPRAPAWFLVSFDRRTLHPLELRMVAPAHFMQHRYSAFNAGLRIVPPRNGA